ncbi:MAG: hypothetical protein ACK6EB_29110, partial [Planctomyces sp.]
MGSGVCKAPLHRRASLRVQFQHVRIRGGAARSCYVGIETAGLALPGIGRPLKALCVEAQGMEEGTAV